MKKRFIKYLVLIILCQVFLFITMSSYASNVSKDLKDNFFRLHIIANSDSLEDQSLKLKVRDAIIAYMKNLDPNISSKEESLIFVQNNLDNFKEIASKVIADEGYTYPISLDVGTFYFPTKQYANLSLPAGYYDGLKIEIGNATGQNWWCSLFPPLCFVDVSSGILDDESSEKLEENLDDEEFAVITNNSKSVKLKFKVLELLSK